ncbi:TRAP transporter large permease [Pseudodonghicola sp.]|uniref:TRAP transporter large permease n=1 Tax=Pseudodonghicola sp. TaxID=1969463 RepID=UPI003A980B88
MVTSILGLAAVLILSLLRVPIAIAMSLVGVIGYAMETSMSASISMAARLITDASQDYSLTVVPLFVLMGLFVNKGGMADELYEAAYSFLGHLRGGLAMATIVACGGFSAISGSSLATAATMSRVAMPQMRRFGYKDTLSTGSIAAGGTLGILIPPSVILIIYGLLTETSIGKLFLAGIVPGGLGILLYLVAVRYAVWRDPAAGPAGERSTMRQRMQALRGVWAILLLFFVVIGGLYGALDVWPIHITFSPTEAAGVGAMGAFLISLFRGQMKLRDITSALSEAVTTTASLFAVLIGAWIFSNYVNMAGLPTQLQTLVLSWGTSPFLVMALIILIYVLLGCVFESMSMLLLTVPVFFPVIVALGFDPVWFGIVVVVVVEISLITPPVGLNVFVLKRVVNDVSTRTIFQGVTPFWIVDLVRLGILVGIPAVTLFLPNSIH